MKAPKLSGTRSGSDVKGKISGVEDKRVCWPTKGYVVRGKGVCWLTKGYVGRQKGFMTASPFQLLRPKSGPQAMSATLELALKCELPNPLTAH